MLIGTNSESGRPRYSNAQIAKASVSILIAFSLLFCAMNLIRKKSKADEYVKLLGTFSDREWSELVREMEFRIHAYNSAKAFLLLIELIVVYSDQLCLLFAFVLMGILDLILQSETALASAYGEVVVTTAETALAAWLAYEVWKKRPTELNSQISNSARNTNNFFQLYTIGNVVNEKIFLNY